MKSMTSERRISWFGKLPCVGDFCSHNMPTAMFDALDQWLSTAMKIGQDTHGEAWTRAYFQTPMHGFVLGNHVLPELEEHMMVGVIMPSVDKVGRTFPFVLLEKLPIRNSSGEPGMALGMDALTEWFSQAYAMCAAAMNDEWTLDRLAAELHRLPDISDTGFHGYTVVTPAGHSEWFRIEFDGPVNWAMQCEGLPKNEAFDMLIGMSRTHP